MAFTRNMVSDEVSPHLFYLIKSEILRGGGVMRKLPIGIIVKPNQKRFGASKILHNVSESM